MQPHHGTAFEQPVHPSSCAFIRFCIQSIPIHFHEPETALSSLATSTCIKATSNGLWDSAWPAVLG